jgi:hypothetical protein
MPGISAVNNNFMIEGTVRESICFFRISSFNKYVAHGMGGGDSCGGVVRGLSHS